MAYTPNEWACGDEITANKLNSIERGIAEVNGEYTPTEWVCGDIITADRMNHIEQGIANAGGGGSSDFSTAEVTFVNSSNDGDEYVVMVIQATEGGMMLTPRTVYYNPVTVNLPLYKGKYMLFPEDFSSIDQTSVPTCTGDITFDSDEGYFLIEGNGTITCKGTIDSN